jgi:hypothetical protein
VMILTYNGSPNDKYNSHLKRIDILRFQNMLPRNKLYSSNTDFYSVNPHHELTNQSLGVAIEMKSVSLP